MLSNIQTETLFDFHDERAVQAFYNIDDGVMGGVSQGLIQRGDGSLLFSGMVRLENNGGFSSIWARFQPTDVSRFDGLYLRVRGDGKRYRVYLKDRNTPYPISYQAPFETREGEWIDVTIPFSALRPQWYGRNIPAMPINLRQLNTISLIIEDKQRGAFTLEVERIGVYTGAINTRFA
jgi:monofunctional biosynthetic peptidoglycan transglycosylase